jgi:glycosyltransferase involved in cell wall biosynthesis
MRIAMLLDAVYPTDVRVEKETRALAAAGHDVFVLSYADAGLAARETVAGATVVRRPLQRAHHGLRGSLLGLRALLTGVHGGWVRELRSLVDEEAIEAIHVHDLPLALTGLAVGDDRDLPVVLDLHENWPEAVRLYRQVDTLAERLAPRRLISDTFNSPRRWERVEREAVSRADLVVTVAEEARDHYIRDCGADPDRVRVVSNYVRLESFEGAVEPLAGYDDEFVISYVGTLGGRHRGLDAVVRAMPTVRERVPNARLLVVGGGAGYKAELEALVDGLGVADAVTFTGRVPFASVPGCVAASDVCLVPHLSTGHTETTIPHKLFQYMAMAKPVVVTDVAPLRRIVDATDAGVVVPSDDDAAFAAALIELANDPAERARLGANGRRAVEERYNWDQEAATLVAAYADLANPTEMGAASTRTRTDDAVRGVSTEDVQTNV